MRIYSFKESSEASSPKVDEQWLVLSNSKRLDVLKNVVIKKYSDDFSFIEARNDGHVYIELNIDLDINIRSGYLLDLELYLKRHIDPAITVWVKPIADKSSLRKLRGIEVKL